MWKVLAKCDGGRGSLRAVILGTSSNLPEKTLKYSGKKKRRERQCYDAGYFWGYGKLR